MNDKITLERLLKLLKQNFHILIIWTIVTLSMAAFYTFYLVEPVYESTSKIVVNDTSEETQTFTSIEIDTNLSLINTYQSIILEPVILEEVIRVTGTNYTVEELNEKISFRDDEMSLIFGVTVSDNNPEVAAELANTTAEVFQTQIIDILPVRSVTILSPAVPNPEPVSPSVALNLLFGAMAGLFMGYLHIFLRDLIDKRVRSDEIFQDLDWIHLGSVSLLSEHEKQKTKLLIEPLEEKETEMQVFTQVQKER